MSEEEITVSTTDTHAASDDAGNLSETPLTGWSETDPQGSRIIQLEQQVSELEQKLARESEQATDYMNRYQRIQADFANFKRRAQQEQEQQNLVLTAQVITLFLPALDSFERAFATLPPSLRGYSWIDGISLVLMEMQHALNAYGVQPIEVKLGQAFDPSRHESVGEVETSEYADGHIAVILQSGYAVQGRTLRPALVQLARSVAAVPAESTGAADADETASSGQGNQ